MPGGKRSKVEEGVTVATLASVSIIVISSARRPKREMPKQKGGSKAENVRAGGKADRGRQRCREGWRIPSRLKIEV
jgi:hypothetical protein